MTITEFLLARIAEDEAWVIRSDCECGEGWPRLPSCPDRVLAECEAKRAIVALHSGDHVCPSGNGAGCTDYDATRDDDGMRPCPTLRHLATARDDQPGFDEGWRI